MVWSDGLGEGVEFILMPDWRWTWPLLWARKMVELSTVEYKHGQWVQRLRGVITWRRSAWNSAKSRPGLHHSCMFVKLFTVQRNQRAQPSLTSCSLAALFIDSALVHESFLLYNQSRHTLYSCKCFLVCLKCNYIHISNTLTLVPFDIIQNTLKKRASLGVQRNKCGI